MDQAQKNKMLAQGINARTASMLGDAVMMQIELDAKVEVLERENHDLVNQINNMQERNTQLDALLNALAERYPDDEDLRHLAPAKSEPPAEPRKKANGAAQAAA